MKCINLNIEFEKEQIMQYLTIQEKLGFLHQFKKISAEKQKKVIEFIQELIEEKYDANYKLAKDLAYEHGYISHSLLKRQLSISWGEVNRLITLLQDENIVDKNIIASKGFPVISPVSL